MKRMDGRLIDACAVLFGSHTRGRGMAMIDQLDTATVRRAYRTLAVASHPDAARRGGGKQADGKLFIDVSRAYELLMGYLLNKTSAGTNGRAARQPQPTAQRSTSEKHRTDERREEQSRRGGGARQGTSAGSAHPGGARQGTSAGSAHPGGARQGTSAGSAHPGGARQGTSAGSAHPGGARQGTSAGSAHAGGARSGTASGFSRAGSARTGAKQGAGARASAGEKKAAGEKRAAGYSASKPLYYKGPVPKRRLRIAEYLYYTGRIPWQGLIAAIVWQRAAQPRFGELAREMRSISRQDVARILSSRLRHEQTGQTARRLSLLSDAEVERILRLQRARRKPIGRYFIEKGGMTGPDLNAVMWELHAHNARHGKQPRL
jgi:hypothetical protein